MLRMYRSMDHGRFYSVCTGIQAIFLVIGVLGGGAWSVWMYRQLHEEERQRAELVRTQTEVESNRLEHEQRLAELQRGIGQIELTITPLALTGRRSCYLQVTARVQNIGHREIRLEFNHDPLRIAAVHPADDGVLDHVPSASASLNTFALDGTVVPLPTASLLPGETSEYPFLVRIPRRGVYMVQFDVPVDTLPGTESERPWHWAARSYTAGCGGDERRAPAEARTATAVGTLLPFAD